MYHHAGLDAVWLETRHGKAALSILPFENNENPTRIANDTIHGLAAGV